MAHPDVVQRHPTDEPPPRNKVVGGSVSAEEKERVKESLETAGFKNESEGVRAVMLGFVASAEIREAVARWLKAS